MKKLTLEYLDVDGLVEILEVSGVICDQDPGFDSEESLETNGIICRSS